MAGERETGGEPARGENAARKFFHRPWVPYAIGASVIVLVAIGILWWLNARQYESTTDAFIDTHMVHIAPEISGRIVEVPVRDNQLVKKGALLAEIDPATPRAHYQQISAQLANADTQLQQAIANESAAAAKADAAESDLRRYRQLQQSTPLAVAKHEVDQATATAQSAIAARKAAEEQIAGARAQIKSLRAQVQQADITVGDTRIFAPQIGHIAQRNVAIGSYVSAGQEIMAIVPIDLWVTANFKETQLDLMRPGQRATISIDACDQTVKGHVQSIQRGAGQAFDVLPPENATGNFVKVVQRVPVKIVFDQWPQNCSLGPGMSVEPTVKVR